MSANTTIEWADHTFNPWIGCTKVGPGCDNCYAKADFDDRRGRAIWGAGQARSRTKTWGNPVKWNKQHLSFGIKHGRKQRVFCASLADVFDNEVDPRWRRELFDLICETPFLDWLLLTKRIGNASGMLPWMLDGKQRGVPYPNVWLGATICTQEEADRDIPKLLAVPAAKRFLSMEPLLGPVDLNVIQHTAGYGCGPCTGCGSAVYIDALNGSSFCAESCYGPMWPAIDWVIVGGESGSNARPMHPDWARSLRDQCEAAGVPFLFKQWGEWTPGENVQRRHGAVPIARWWNKKWLTHFVMLEHDDGHSDDEPDLYRVGKKAAGRLLDGRTWDGVPS